MSGARAIDDELVMSLVAVQLDRQLKAHKAMRQKKLFGVPSWTENRAILSQHGLESTSRYQAVRSAIEAIEVFGLESADEEWGEESDAIREKIEQIIHDGRRALRPVRRGDYLHPWRTRARRGVGRTKAYVKRFGTNAAGLVRKHRRSKKEENGDGGLPGT